jgi:periplasmic divalent cation tolerance protein
MASPVPTAARVVLITAPDANTARVLARAMVERSLAACVNLVPGVTSIYRWKGALEESAEVLMLAKTTAARVAELEALLVELHPYDTPECVVLEPAHVEAKYLRWLQSETGAPPADA